VVTLTSADIDMASDALPMGHRCKAMQMDGEGRVLRSYWDEDISDCGGNADDALQSTW
jgi:hypothetical protein